MNDTEKKMEISANLINQTRRWRLSCEYFKLHEYLAVTALNVLIIALV